MRKRIVRKSHPRTLLTATAVFFGLATQLPLALAQAAQGQGSPRVVPGITHQQSAAAADVLLNPDDTVVLLLDHQTGLFQTVKDVPLLELRANTVVLAKIAQQGKAPIIYTASEPNGSNGPIMSELLEAAPNAKYVARKGEVSAWDNEDFVQAVKATGRKTLIMAGVWTSVCVAFPAPGESRRLQGLRRHGRLRRYESDGIRRDACAHDVRRNYPGDHECHPL
jgi:hypothetical protein